MASHSGHQEPGALVTGVRGRTRGHVCANQQYPEVAVCREVTGYVQVVGALAADSKNLQIVSYSSAVPGQWLLYNIRLPVLLQMDRDGVLRLQKYSFGNDCTNLIRGSMFPRSYYESCNMAVYGSETVPEYDLSKITAPQAFFVGKWGWQPHMIWASAYHTVVMLQLTCKDVR